MKILRIRSLDGPNLYHAKRVLVMTLDLEDLAETCSIDRPDFIERLTGFLPGLQEHRCSLGRRGGFVERLQRGTYPAHIIEHIALELSGPAGIEVGFGKSVYAGTPGHYNVIVRSKCDLGMAALLRLAVELTEALFRGLPFELAPRLEEAREIVRANRLGPSTQAIVDAAEKRNIPWKRLNQFNLIQFGHGKYRKLIQASTTSSTGDIAVDIAQDKELTRQFLINSRLPAPKGQVVYSVEEAIEAFHDLTPPVAIKPLDANHGKGVSLRLETEEQIKAAFEIAETYSSDVIVEEYLYGLDYRILVVNGKMVAAAQRLPAHVVGDGQLTLAQLIEKENQNPLRGEGHEKPLTKIEMNESSLAFLRRRGKTLDFVPQAGETFFLCETANLSTGGTAVDVTDEVHPETRAICERAARVVGLDIAGIDLIVPDISKPIRGPSNRGGIIEVNAGPGLRMHEHPSKGKRRDVGGAIIDALFPPGQPSQIPIIAITGTNGKTTVTRLSRHILKKSGLFVGCTTSTGIYIGDELVEVGDTTGPASASVVLGDPAVEVAVLETARGGIARRGLGYHWSDVGIITNIQPDHIGQDGIQDLEDILHIKSLVAERVRPGGTVVLNADDPLLQQLAESSLARGTAEQPKKLVFFSLDEQSPVLRRHLMNGGTGFFLRQRHLIEANGNIETQLLRIDEVPITLGGTAVFQIANTLACVAGMRALGVTPQQIRTALPTFSAIDNNPGRCNVYQVQKGFVVLDYGHNPDGIQATGQMVSHWNVPARTAIIAAPGDRPAETIEQIGVTAVSYFSHVIVREDEDLRGRPAGETAEILRRAIEAEEAPVKCSVILGADEAIDQAIRNMKEGEVVVYFYEDHDIALTQLARYGATPLQDFTILTQPTLAPREVG